MWSGQPCYCCSPEQKKSTEKHAFVYKFLCKFGLPPFLNFRGTGLGRTELVDDFKARTGTSEEGRSWLAAGNSLVPCWRVGSGSLLCFFPVGGTGKGFCFCHLEVVNSKSYVLQSLVFHCLIWSCSVFSLHSFILAVCICILGCCLLFFFFFVPSNGQFSLPRWL